MKGTRQNGEESNNHSCNPDASITEENGDEYVHRLVQDENAKTILLNVPLETNPTASGKMIYMFRFMCAGHYTDTLS